MREIPLPRGYVAFVDDEDYPRLSKIRWQVCVSKWQVRAMRSIGRARIYMHHDILDRLPFRSDGLEVDHIDRNPLNNCKENLRLVTHTQNMRNTERHKNRKGYCYNKRAKLWCVYLDRPDKERIYLGYTKTEEEAIARVEEARRAHIQNA